MEVDMGKSNNKKKVLLCRKVKVGAWNKTKELLAKYPIAEESYEAYWNNVMAL